MEKNNTVEIVRAFSAFYVMALHVMMWCIGWNQFTKLPNPKIAVDLFIIISGFLMMQVFWKISSVSFSTVGAFYIKRFFRIAPMYYFTLLLAVAISGYFIGGYTTIQNAYIELWPADSLYRATKTDYSLENILLHMSFLFGLFPKASLSTLLPDWSIGLEMQFYLLFPLLFLFLRSPHVTMTALIALIVANRIDAHYINSMAFSEPSFITLKLHLFILGMLIFLAINPATSNASKICYILICIGVAIHQAKLYGFSPKEYRFWILPIFALTFYYFSKNDGLLGKLPSILKRLIAFMSDTSYSVFLLHGFFISACGLVFFRNANFLQMSNFGKLAVTLPFVVGLSYLSAYLCYRFIELPGITLGGKVADRITKSKLKSTGMSAKVSN